MRHLLMKMALVIFIFGAVRLNALELYQQGLSARYLGMGGTSVAFAKGVDALFLNPAALSKTEGLMINLATIDLAASTNTQTLYDKLASSGSEHLRPLI